MFTVYTFRAKNAIYYFLKPVKLTILMLCKLKKKCQCLLGIKIDIFLPYLLIYNAYFMQYPKKQMLHLHLIV